MTAKDLVVSADGHVLEPTDLFVTRLPKDLRDRAVWEEDFEIEPLVEGGARIFRRLHTPGFDGWTISRYRQTGGRMPEGDPALILEDMDLDGVDVQVMHPNLSLFGLYSDARPAHVEVRSFAPAAGVPEDPVCGSGNGCVAALIRRDTVLPVSSYRASQGRRVGRDGRVEVEFAGDGVIWLGGQAVTCVEGTLCTG